MGNKFEIEAKNDEYAREYVHECKLPREIDVISYFIPDSQRIRQWFRKQCLISPQVSHRRLCVKSYRALEQDRAVHLTTHYFIIHPFSAFRFYWEIFMIIVYFIQLITTPYIIILEWVYFRYGVWFAAAVQIITFSDIVVKCMSGYFEPATRDIVLEPWKIIKNYIFKCFIVDLIGSLPLVLIFYLLNHGEIVVRSILLLILFNVCSFIDYTERFREKRQLPLCSFRLLQFVIIYVIGMLWFTCFIGIAVHIDQDAEFKMEMWWLFSNNVFILIFSLGSQDFILHGFELYVHFFAIIFGFILRNVVIAQVVLLFKSYYSSKRKYTQLLSELKEFSHFKRLPKPIKKRIFDYYNFVFQHYYYNENEIWNLMSDKLKYEIEKNVYKIWFEADIFKFCPPQVMQSLVLYLKKEIYLGNDIIYSFGSLSDYIYFLKCGTVALYNEVNQELSHVQEGSFFSDSALVLETEIPHDCTAIAVESCEIYKLNRDDFREVIQYFPNEYKVILDILEKRKIFTRSRSRSTADVTSIFKRKDDT